MRILKIDSLDETDLNPASMSYSYAKTNASIFTEDFSV